MYFFDEKVGRRKFFRIGGTAAAAGAAATLPGCGKIGAGEHPILADASARSKWGREAGDWIPSCCNMCGGQSGILVHVVNGVVEKIEPNHWNPTNYSNISSDFFDGYSEEYGCKEGGAICPKGNAGIMQLYDPDRVKKPLKRTNPDKSPGADPRWQEITWDQALDEIAAKLRSLRDADDAHKLLWMSEDHSFTHIQDDFCKLFGTPNYSNHSNLCDVARKASFLTVCGDDRPLADFIQSRYILLFGWNPTSAIKWVYLPRILTRAVEKGARLVVVDPYLSDTAAKAHEWVAIRPGTDGALALAMGHVIIRDQLYDKEFVEKWTVGFDEYAAYVKDKSPGWAETITSVPAKTIERLAREFATTRPACVDVWSGPGQHSNGVQGGRAIAALGALVGGYDRPGTLTLPDKKGNKHADVEADEIAAKTLKEPRFDELKKYPLGHKSGVYCQMFENLAAGKGPYQPKMLVCIFQNPMMSVPGSQTVAKALGKLETVVVIDTMMSETAMLADYVLPGTTYLERYDLNTHWVTWPCLGLRQPVVKPLFGQLAEYETIAALGRRLDLRDKSGKQFFLIGPLSGEPIEDLTAWYEDNLSNELKKGAPGITLAELKALPGAVWFDKKGTRYEKFAEPIPDDKLRAAWFDGDPNAEGTAIYDKPKDKGGKRIGTVIGGKPVRGFFTNTGKVEFLSMWLAGKKDAQGRPVDALPVYTPRDWRPSVEYPLYLINWKEASHTHTRTQNNPWLLDIKPDNPLIIHPQTAAHIGVRDGDEVWVASPYGKVRARVKLSRRIHPEVVGLQHGFGHTALGLQARGRGTSDALLRPTKADPLSGQGIHKEACVQIVRIQSSFGRPQLKNRDE
ncbi:MAG: molybdopterin-dependent oxidoreductase [Planctomycetes bacterium]|nr:molybdopterin-dependent oxidoreductase [Planctomycetota bacterium]